MHVAQRILRLFAGITGVFFLALGLAFLFAPDRQTVRFSLFPSGNAGYNTLRGDFGGLFLGMALFCFLGAIRAVARWLAVPAAFLGFIVLGRLLSLVFDGASKDGARMMLVEVALLTVLLLAIRSVRDGAVHSLGLGWAAAIPALLLLLLGLTFVFQRQFGLMVARQMTESAIQKQAWVAELPDGLHAGLCGSGSPLPDLARAGPCVFVIAGKHLYIVDAGEGSPRKMLLMLLPPASIDGILLTHFHSDHIAGLGEMMIQRWAGGSHSDPTPVFGPQGVESVVQGFNDAYALDKGYRVAHHGAATMPPSGAGGVARPFTIDEGSDQCQVVVQQDGLTITAFPVNHAPVHPAVGYRFDYHGRSIVISGDTAPSPVLEKYARGVDVLFHEGLQTDMVSILGDAAARNNRSTGAKIMGDIPSYHTRPEDAARIAQKAGVGHLIFYHTIPPLPSSFLNAAFLGDAAKFYTGPITVSKDGTMVSLRTGSKSIVLREML
jgi:ribonuclease Z